MNTMRSAGRSGWALAVVMAAGLVGCAAGAGSENPRGDAAHDAGARAEDARVAPVPADDAGTLPGEPDAATGAPDAGPTEPAVAPLTAPARTWTWIDIPGSQCADGSPTGIGVNLNPASDRVLIFLEGGGACWDGTSCWGPVSTSFYIATGYGRAEFATDPQIPVMLPLQRARTDNPFRDMNFIYVPYCTGDAHAGNNVVSLSFAGITHETHFVGYRNLDLYLARVRATFPDVARVWLSGDSAGGFGSAFNFGHVQQAFPRARVDVLDDSGQPVDPDPAQWQLWQAAWHPEIPDGCTGCREHVSAFVDYYRAAYPASRFGLISYDYDVVISPFMNLTLAAFHDELYALGDHVDRTWPNARYYILAGASHVGLAAATPGLTGWLAQMVSDDPAWSSHRP